MQPGHYQPAGFVRKIENKNCAKSRGLLGSRGNTLESDVLSLAICAAVVWTSGCASSSPRPLLFPQTSAQLSAPVQIIFGDLSLPVPAFPGAQGGGALAVGGRGGTVYEVTNLNDSGAGSLRACVQASGPRTCVFRTGGHLTLHSQLYIGNPYLTIAGQTALGGGIELSAKDPNGSAYFNDDLIRIETHDVVIRYVKMRLGYNASANYQNTIVIQASNQYNIVVDHCSIYWGMWDDISVYATNTGSNKNITFSWNIIAEPLLQPGASGTVATNISGANSTIADASTDLDFHHNLFASADHRTPLHTVRSGRLVNNIVYNWNYYALRTKGSKDIIGNYFKPGPMNLSPAHEIHAWTTNDGNDTSYAPSLYLAGNAGPHNSFNPSTDNWSTLTALACNESAGECSSPLSSTLQRATPLAISGVAITADSATSLATSGGNFLTTVGASQKLNDAICDGTFTSNRDSVDTRVVNQFLSATGISTQALQSESQVGGFPALSAGTACTDTGHDGMTDVWESAHGLNPGDPTNATKIAPNGYTYLENYLNGTDPNVAN
jgi:pectate lyase